MLAKPAPKDNVATATTRVYVGLEAAHFGGDIGPAEDPGSGGKAAALALDAYIRASVATAEKAAAG